MSIRKPKEGDLVKQCLTWLKLRYPQGVFWRQNSGSTKIGDRFIKFNSMPGVSDIVGVMPTEKRIVGGSFPGELRWFVGTFGVFLAVECKMPKGRLQPSQAAFLEAVKAAGGIAGVVRSLEELERLVGEN